MAPRSAPEAADAAPTAANVAASAAPCTRLEAPASSTAPSGNMSADPAMNVKFHASPNSINKT